MFVGGTVQRCWGLDGSGLGASSGAHLSRHRKQERHSGVFIQIEKAIKVHSKCFPKCLDAENLYHSI